MPLHNRVLNRSKSPPYFFNLKNGLNTFKSSLNGLNSVIDVNCIGDSITAGTGAGTGSSSPYNDIWDNCWVTLLRNYFKTKYNDVGKGLINHSWWYKPDHIILTYGGTWTTHNAGNEGYGSESQTDTTGATVTTTFTGTGIRIFYRQAATTCDFSVAIDGGIAQNITGNGTSIKAAHTDITGLEQGEHTIVITTLNTGGRTAFRFHGIMELNASTKGVRVNNMGTVGAGAYLHWPLASSDISRACSTGILAKLSIIEIGINDKLTNVTIPNFTTGVSDMITSCKAQGGDVLILITGTSSTSGTYAWSLYEDALKQLAITNNCALINFNKKWSGSISSMTTDGVHPNPAGHWDKSNTIIQALGV